MRLVDLDPRWVGHGGEGISDKDGHPVPLRERIGVSFLCPCAPCTGQRTGDRDHDFSLRVFVAFANPSDGGGAVDGLRPSWTRTGETFETLVLSPSILSIVDKGGCGWHGYVGGPDGQSPGEVVTV